MSSDNSVIQPRVLIVSRRTVRKNKLVDFVGEYHLELIVRYGAVPVIVPRVSGIDTLLKSFEPIHGVLLCEGEDIDPSWYHKQDEEDEQISKEDLDEITSLHAGDTSIDKDRDYIEFTLANLCLQRNIPYLGICRGSQLLNVACGGTLYQDISKQLPFNNVIHINYHEYDAHRHAVKLVKNTPLHRWFQGDEKEQEINIFVNSYHHQGVKKLAKRFVPMAFASDGLIEGFYDPNAYNPQDGKFIMGLQFHPERMRKPNSDEFDYPGCPFVYKEFVKAVIAYQKKLNSLTCVPKPLKLNNKEMETKRKIIMRSFSLAKDNQVEVGAQYLEPKTALSVEEENGLKEMGERVETVEQLYDLLSFYRTMAQICSQVLETKLHHFTS